MGYFSRNRDTQNPRTRTQIQNTKTVLSHRQCLRLVDSAQGHGLSFRSGNKYPGSHTDLKAQKRCVACEVLEWLTFLSSDNQSFQSLQMVSIKLATTMRTGQHFTSRDAQYVRG